MGVYYSTTIAYGFPAPPAPEGQEYEYEWWEEACPKGFQYTTGGDQMSDENVGAVFALRHHIREVFHTGNFGASDDGFGIHRLDGFIEVTDEDRDRIIEAARQLGVDDQHVGYYVISSVG